MDPTLRRGGGRGESAQRAQGQHGEGHADCQDGDDLLGPGPSAG
ncbi:hypothetical protein [Micromonospora sp. NPDC049900]